MMPSVKLLETLVKFASGHLDVSVGSPLGTLLVLDEPVVTF